MQYDEFRRLLLDQLQEASLRMIGLYGEERLDVRSLDRHFTVHLEPSWPSELAEPFQLAATIKFRWPSLMTARMDTTEEDFLHEVFGNDDRHESAVPTVRVDVTLVAHVMPRHRLSPAPAAVQRWGREASGRLADVEPIVREDMVRETVDGRLEVLAWAGKPELKFECDPNGYPTLDSVRITGFEMVAIPRQWDDPDRATDDDPEEQLARFAARIRASLYAWGEVLDHLKG